MIAGGADVSRGNKYGTSPLDVAARRGDPECTNTLLKAGANVNNKASNKITPLFSAAHGGSLECMKLLIEAGADVNDVDECGNSPAHWSTGYGKAECLKLLIEVEADVNLSNNEGYTALMMMASNNARKSVDSLLNTGADVNLTDQNGETALICAARGGSCVHQLSRAGAHVNKFNAFGQNALQTHIACNESKDIAMLLYIAGETIDCSTVIKYAEDGEIIGQVEVPEYLFRRDLRLRLEHMCREAIRKHLIKVNPHSHLFSRIPQLPLPSALTQYLL